MWRRRPGGCTILPAPHLRRTDMHPSRCASAVLERRGQHTGRVSRRADVPGRECRVARAHEEDRL
eukprot:1541364-Prymnesium_polylepis.1